MENGRRLINELNLAVDGSFPMEDWMIRVMWRSGFALMSHLLEGITALETRLEILVPFPADTILRYAAHAKSQE